MKLDNDKDLMMGQHVLIEQDNGQDEQKEGMWLPSAYIKKNNNKYYVWLDSHNKLKLHEIQVGEYDENLDEYEVKSGLKTSDYIACDDSTLKEGPIIATYSPSSIEIFTSLRTLHLTVFRCPTGYLQTNRIKEASRHVPL